MKRSRSGQAILNTVCGAIDEIVTLICGLILPRLILLYFGSKYNGIMSSINQFVSIVAILEGGVFGVSKVALFKPLSVKDNRTISEITNQTQKFFRKVAMFFILFSLIFAVVYPLFVKDEFSWTFAFSLVLIVSFPRVAQYCFGLTYQILLSADQKIYIRYIVNALTTIVNTIIASLLIVLGLSIHIVKIGSAIIYIISPIILMLLVRKKYCIDKKAKPREDYLKERWNALGHEFADFINNNTDIIVLTVFATLLEVSVYTVYYAVVNGIKSIVRIFINGFGSAFGDMYVKGEMKLLKENFRLFELIVFLLSTILYSITISMIVSYALIYTDGVYDVNYNRPVFAIILVSAFLFSCYRIPYETLTKSIGHFKQTRNGAFFEAFLNIFLSIIFVIYFGLVGVAIGSLVACAFRTIQYALYVSKNVLKRSAVVFFRRIIVSIIIVASVYLISLCFLNSFLSIGLWFLKAIIVGIISCVLSAIFVLIFDKKDFLLLIKKIRPFKRNKIVID